MRDRLLIRILRLLDAVAEGPVAISAIVLISALLVVAMMIG